MTKFLHVLWNGITWGLFLGCLGWGLWRCLKRSATPESILFKLALTGALLLMDLWALSAGAYAPLFVVFFTVPIAFLWTPYLGRFLLSPLTDAFDGGLEEVEPQPFYAIAQARRKRGDYLAAIDEIQKQLQRFPTDVTGWLLLAEVQADDLKDLAAAQATLERFLAQPEHAPKNVAHALHRLADWQLKLALDPEAARTTLERIGQRFPETPEAQIAAQRIAHLASSEFLAQQKDRPRLVLRAYEDNLGLKGVVAGVQAPHEDPEALATEYVRHLEEFPLDNEVREKLAQLYADHFQRLDLAIGQLEQLIAQPTAAPGMVAHWLNRLADLQIAKGGDEAAARAALQRIVDRFPRTALAEKARHRLAHLNLELRRTKTGQPLKLGAYEQNLGLKMKNVTRNASDA